jgi:hypothetical protein
MWIIPSGLRREEIKEFSIIKFMSFVFGVELLIRN